MTLDKFFKGLFCCLLTLALLGCSGARDVKFYDNKGNVIQLSSLNGKWVIINYWAEWCPACRYEVPELNHFYQHNTDKTVILLGVNPQPYAPVEMDAAIKQSGIDFPVLRQDPGSAWQLAQPDMIPMTFILDPQGKLVKTIVGVNTEKSLTETIHHLKEDAN
jgi:peroxiredoxin